jgi:hypothetical protein
VRASLRLIALAAAAALIAVGCGAGASRTVLTFPPETVGPNATVSAAMGPTRAAIVAALSQFQLQLTDANRPFRPAETARLAAAPRSVFQVVLPQDPEGGFVVVYEFRDAAAAVDAGNEIAGFLGTGAGKVNFPLDAQHTIRQLGTMLIFYTWAPSTSPDPGSPLIAQALATLGIGFTPPR